jgi:hypothetical protein
MAYMQWEKAPVAFDYGRLALGLEVVTLIRTLESLPVVNDAEREGTVACLATLLREQGLEDAYEVYDRLNDWRRVRFEPLPPATDAVGVPLLGYRPVSGDGSSSALDARDQERVRRGRLRERGLERRGPVQGASPIDGQLELPVAGERETPNG